MTTAVGNRLISVTVTGAPEALLTCTDLATGESVGLAAPALHIDGRTVTAALDVTDQERREVGAGIVEYRFGGRLREVPTVGADVVVRLAEDSRVVRFRYRLRGDGHRLTKPDGRDALTYLRLPLAGCTDLTEVRFSEFDALTHSYLPTETPVPERDLPAEPTLVGPLVTARRGGLSLLVGYEHGAQAPDTFLRYAVSETELSLSAVKGNYLDGQELPYTTVWCHLALVPGGPAALAAEYRGFLLRGQSDHRATRRPYLSYNTWALQERAKWWDRGRYLDPMTEKRILAEIDAAHRLGIDIFVIDTGWYARTGDWQVNTERFGEALAAVRERLDEYGMRLGLWFGPADAAVSSAAYRAHERDRMSWQGKHRPPAPVWETAESNRMCLVSPYGDRFADELVRLAAETGVSYFKWDALDQYGCDDPHHWHGDGSHSPAERADSYAFQMPLALTRIAERVCRAVPEAVVDFDITEQQRAFGLAFLAAGRYFLVNNGPYYSSYDVPPQDGRNPNLFFFPGAARATLCRTTVAHDRWIPATLLLTHYLPDDPAPSQRVNVASLILGHNGIWGDLAGVSEQGMSWMADVLRRYRYVRDDMAAAAPVRRGPVGGSPEIHEKIDPATGRGAVVVFSPAAGEYRYVTAARPATGVWHTGEVSASWTDDHRADLRLVFDRPGAAIVFFS